MTRIIQIAAVLGACLIGVLIGNGGFIAWPHLIGHAAAQPDGGPIAILPTGSAAGTGGPATHSTDALIRQYQKAVQADPRSADGFTNLALAYMQKERETGDVTYYRLTEDAANTAHRLDAHNPLPVTIQTWVAMGRHDFARAARMAQSAVKVNGGAESYGNLGDAEANLGNYPAMLTAYQRMVDLKPSLASYNRASYARWLYGDVRGATRFMLMAIRAGSSQPENVAWCQSQLGDDFFNAGFILGAQQQYAAALHTFPHEAPALAGMAQVEIALGHPRSAIRYYKQAIAVIPLPQYLTGLGDLYSSLGQRRQADQQYATIRFIERIYAINHIRYGIEEAQFDADHNIDPAHALRIAQTEATTRHDIQTEDILAWTLYMNHRYAAAWKAEQQALRLHTQYAPYFFHAGMIQAKLGNLTRAQSYLHLALMVNPNFHVLFARTARAELQRLNRQVAGRR